MTDFAGLSELAAEFPGYDFGTQPTWDGTSIIAIRQRGSDRPGLCVVITADAEEMRRALADGERAAGLTHLEIAVDDLTGPQIARFLEEHLAEMLSVSPPESKHALDLDALRAPDITFWSVTDGATVVGCGALKRLDAAHAEVKSMRTLPTRKRSGIASLILGHIIAEAGRMGFSRLSLETGSAEFFAPARRLYEKFGFTYCEPFADYRPDPLSVFLTKAL